MTYGRPERIEAEYTRHGTLTLIGNFDVTTGELITPTIGPTRTELDFVEHIAHTVATDPEAGWIFVVDNLNIHGSEMLVRLVAKACGIAEPLGRKTSADPQVGGQPASVPVGEGPPGPVRVHAEAQFVAEPDRDGLRSNHEEGDSAGSFSSVTTCRASCGTSSRISIGCLPSRSTGPTPVARCG